MVRAADPGCFDGRCSTFVRFWPLPIANGSLQLPQIAHVHVNSTRSGHNVVRLHTAALIGQCLQAGVTSALPVSATSADLHAANQGLAPLPAASSRPG